MLNAPDVHGARILIVDDEPANVQLLERVLADAGYTNVVATLSPRDVGTLHDDTPFDLILLDLQMPGMDGYEATRMIRSGANPLGRTIPIIAMTANAFAEDVKKSLDAGMNAHLSKPVDLNALEQTLQRFRYEPSAEQPQ